MNYLDPSFGNGGLIRPANTFSTLLVRSNMVMQPDGKILVKMIENQSSTVKKASLLRFLPDGTPDNSFGTGGKIEFGVINLYFNNLYNMLELLPDGKMLTGYTILNSDTVTSVVARLNPDGSYDTSFGTNGKTSIIDIATWIGHFPGLVDIKIQNNGTIVMIYNSGSGNYSDFGFRYLNGNGTFPAQNNDILWWATENIKEHYKQSLMLPNNHIVIGGTDFTSGNAVNIKFVLAQFEPDGYIHDSFGDQGFVLDDISQNGDYLGDIALQENDKILAAGSATNIGLLLSRYLSDGSPDPNFGNNGQIIHSGLLSNGPTYNLALSNQSADHSFVVAAEKYSTNGMLPAEGGIMRFLENGSIDTTFSPTGLVYLPVAATQFLSVFSDVVVLPDRRILVCGFAKDSLNSVLLARFLPESDAVVWYTDLDNDGYGNNSDSLFAVVPPAGYTAIAGDCNDQNPAVYPDAIEICSNNTDDNCNGVIDEDNLLPVAACIENLTVTLDDTGLFTLNAAMINNGSTDNCGIVSTAVSPAQFSVLNLGNNTVTLTVTDASGNENTCQAVVEVTQTSGSTAVAEQEWLQLSPNPANDQLIFHFSEGFSEGLVQIEISDPRGRIVVSQQLLLQKQQQQAVDISGLPAGIYFFRSIDSKHKQQTSQFVVTH